jgi:hypothetical protein
MHIARITAAIESAYDEISSLVYEAIVSSRHRWKLARSQ